MNEEIKGLDEVTYKDLEMVLRGEKELKELQFKNAVDYLEFIEPVLMKSYLLKILNSLGRALMDNKANDLLKACTGKEGYESLENISVKDIELVMNKAIELKEYGIASRFAEVYLKIMRYFKD